jgi:hypothetical protein
MLSVASIIPGASTFLPPILYPQAKESSSKVHYFVLAFLACLGLKKIAEEDHVESTSNKSGLAASQASPKDPSASDEASWKQPWGNLRVRKLPLLPLHPTAPTIPTMFTALPQEPLPIIVITPPTPRAPIKQILKPAPVRPQNTLPVALAPTSGTVPHQTRVDPQPIPKPAARHKSLPQRPQRKPQQSKTSLERPPWVPSGRGTSHHKKYPFSAC